MALPISFRWDEEFVRRIDEARGLVPRSAFVRAAVERVLAEEGSPVMEGMRGLASAFGVTDAQWKAAVESERPEGSRSSSHAKRDVRPIPKGKR